MPYVFGFGSRLLGVSGGGDWHTARGAGVSRVEYSDGQEIVWRDARGRITRHHLSRAGRVGFDRCFAYRRVDGRVRRVPISFEEWEQMQRPRAGGADTQRTTPSGGAGHSAMGLSREWYESMERGETPAGNE